MTVLDSRDMCAKEQFCGEVVGFAAALAQEKDRTSKNAHFEGPGLLIFRLHSYHELCRLLSAEISHKRIDVLFPGWNVLGQCVLRRTISLYPNSLIVQFRC